MALIDFIGNIFPNKTSKGKNWHVMSGSGDTINANYLAKEVAIDLISKSISLCKFETYVKGKLTIDRNHYIYNVEPNQNKSASVFWYEVTNRLLRDSEALIIMHNEELLLVDSFTRNINGLEGNTYSDVLINNKSIDKEYTESQVLYLNYDNRSLNNAINSIDAAYSKLISSAIKGYKKKNVTKGIVSVETSFSQTLDAQEELDHLFEVQMKEFLDDEKDSVLSETEGIKYRDLANEKGGSKSNESDRSVKNLVNDVIDFVSIAFGIPPSLLKGDVVDTEQAVKNFITFCINPIAKIINDEINRKQYGFKLYKQNSYVRLDTTAIQTIDIADKAKTLDILTRIGANTIDDNLKALGRETVGGDIGNLRFVTKNYETIENALKGGD